MMEPDNLRLRLLLVSQSGRGNRVNCRRSLHLCCASLLLMVLLLGCRGAGTRTSESRSDAVVQASSLNDFHVGRLTLSAPGPVTVVFQKAQITDVELSWMSLAGTHFDQWLAHRTGEIKAGGMSMGRQAPLIRSYRLQNTPVNLFWLFPGQNIQRLEAYEQFGDAVLVVGDNPLPEEVPTAERLLTSVLQDFHPYPQAGDAGGFAVEGGIVHRAFQSNEIAEAHATVDIPSTAQGGTQAAPLHLKYDVTTHVYANAAPGTLPARVRKGEAAMLLIKAQSPGFRWQSLRNSSRIVAGVRGDEYFLTTRDTEKGPNYTAHAEFEYGGEASDPKRPHLQIIFNAEDVPASVPGADLLKMWDGLLNSGRFEK